MRAPLQPAFARPLDAASDSGRLERKTATTNAIADPSPSTSATPIAADSGMPSRTMPSTIASAPPSAWSPPELFRASAP